MPTLQERLKQAENSAADAAARASRKAQQIRQKAKPALRDAADRAKPKIQGAVERAKPAVEGQAKRGRSAIDDKLAERKAKREVREYWFQTESGPVYTAGYPDRESTRLGVQAAAEHGWRVETTAPVPEKRGLVGGLTVSVAKQAVDRVLKPDRFLVTFRKDDDAETSASSEVPAADA
jgi:hypothetical protein